jgi:hypothetical protein
MMRKLAVLAVAFVTVLALATLACSKGANASAQGAPQATGTGGARQVPTPSDIDSLLAPVALYPDALLAQILMSAQDPQNLVKLNDFLKRNTALKGTELQDAAVVEGFEPNFVALALFPQVVSMMVSKLDWTTLVGQMFAADKTAVFASIQKLRGQAQNAGNLKSNPQQQVEVQKTSSGDQVIVIEPTNPQIVYVPQYNPTVVYTQPAPTTVVVQDNSADAAAAAMIGFTAGIVIGSAVNNNYYYGPYGWHGGAYMYNDAWNDYYDHREDAREDWMDHREDLSEERTDRRENASEQRSDRVENRSENRPDSQQRQQAAQQRQGQRQASGTQAGTQSTQQRTTRSSGSNESRGYSSGGTAPTASADRSGTRSDAFSGYSSGSSERAASSRGQASRSSASRSGGSRGGGSRSGGGRRR